LLRVLGGGANKSLMNDSEMQIAIAEACGWKVHPKNDSIVIPPNSPNSVQPRHTLPDYLNDLNAMHEAEKVLNDVQRIHFSTQIMHSHNAKGGRGCSPFDYGHATARQRAEAFLKTLNLWKP